MKFYTVRINRQSLRVQALDFNHAILQAALFYGVEFGLVGQFSIKRIGGF